MAFGLKRRVGRTKRPFARTGTARRKLKRSKVTRRSGARKSYSASPMTNKRGKAQNPMTRAKTMMQSGQPKFQNLPDGALRLQHREFIKDIIVPTGGLFFLHEQRHIQPGDATMAPWLARIAVNFQTYSIMNMAFHFNSTSAAFGGSSTQALGEIIGAYHDNVSARTPVDKQSLLQLQKSLSMVVSNNATFPIPASTGFRYIRSEDSVVSGSHGDRDTYDEGKFFLATQGVGGASSVNIGELWISYDIVLAGKASSAMTNGSAVGHLTQIAIAANSGGTASLTNPIVFGQTLNSNDLIQSAGSPLRIGHVPGVSGQVFYLPYANTIQYWRITLRVNSYTLGGAQSTAWYNGAIDDAAEKGHPMVQFTGMNRCYFLSKPQASGSPITTAQTSMFQSSADAAQLWGGVHFVAILVVNPSASPVQSADVSYPITEWASFRCNQLGLAMSNAFVSTGNVTTILTAERITPDKLVQL